jgi:hypothetical protein
MRALLVALPVLLLLQPAQAQSTLPEGVEQLLTCANVYSMKSDAAKEEGDDGAATEFFNMGDALVWQARAVLEAAGYTADRIENVEMNSALVTGFRYGAGEDQSMLDECLAAADSP